MNSDKKGAADSLQLIEKGIWKPIFRKTASKAVSDACEDIAFATKCVALQEHDFKAAPASLR
ncbi:hypothetical protein [Metaplanococcus flavidus]|uniref:Uncharacterized protein n=1 Tax=Metaplanococcus flavidus TaxID=569883 RepID=A0ABW3LD66_9BACL